MKFIVVYGFRGGGSCVSTVTELWAEWLRFDSLEWQRFFSSSPPSDRLCGPLYLVSDGYWVLFPRG